MKVGQRAGFLATAILGLTVTPQAHAQLAPLEIVFERHMQWGLIPSLVGTCTMRFNGGLSGTCSGFGPATAARFDVVGEPNTQILVTVSNGTSSHPSLVFVPEANREVVNLTGKGKRAVDVAGSLSILAPVGGYHELSYTVMVNYQ